MLTKGIAFEILESDILEMTIGTLKVYFLEAYFGILYVKKVPGDIYGICRDINQPFGLV